jgi:hypothetical protein
MVEALIAGRSVRGHCAGAVVRAMSAPGIDELNAV